MAGMGAGYDLSVSTFSPDGRVFQVEYATKAVDNGCLCVAVACSDGVVMAVEKRRGSSMVLKSSNRRIYAVTPNIGMIVGGLGADGRQLWHRACGDARTYRNTYGVDISINVLAERIALYMHAYSLYWFVRPFGNSVIIGGIERAENGVQWKGALYTIEPSGCCSKYTGTALGKGRPSAKTEIEKLDLTTLSAKEVIPKLMRIFLSVEEESHNINDKQRDIEISVIGGEWGGGLNTKKYYKISDEYIENEWKKVKDSFEAMDQD